MDYNNTRNTRNTGNTSNARSAAAERARANSTAKKRNKEVEKKRKAAVKANRKGKAARVIVRISLTVLVIAICVVAFLATYKLFYDVPMDEDNKTKIEYTIPEEGITDEEVAEFLVENGLIKDARIYKYRTYIYDAKYVPGTYKLSPSYTTEKIINILSGYDYSDGTMEED
ncbi:MAG: hypothetical protein J5483_03020 [Lachnospiraceae bacterium]|nr:hypothetical protein [Lachnospiraceae bacterium]